MYGRSTGFQAYTVPPTLFHDFRFFQNKGIDRRDYDSVSCFLYFFQRIGNLVIGVFHLG